MKIPDVIRLKQEQHVHNEKEVLTEVTHPFIIRLWVPTHTTPTIVVQGAAIVPILVFSDSDYPRTRLVLQHEL